MFSTLPKMQIVGIYVDMLKANERDFKSARDTELEMPQTSTAPHPAALPAWMTHVSPSRAPRTGYYTLTTDSARHTKKTLSRPPTLC